MNEDLIEVLPLSMGRGFQHAIHIEATLHPTSKLKLHGGLQFGQRAQAPNV